MMTPCDIELKLGQVWEEVDSRYTPFRQVKVLDWTYEGHRPRVKIQGTGRPTWAKLDRFNGRSSGYRYVSG